MNVRHLFVCIGCLSFAMNVYAEESWRRDQQPSYWHEDSDKHFDESWNPEVREAPDSQPWHALNRWQGHADKDRDSRPLSIDLDTPD